MNEPHPASDPDALDPEDAKPDTLPQWQPPAGATLAVQSGRRLRDVEAVGVASTLEAEGSAEGMAERLAASGAADATAPEALPPGSLVGGRYVVEELISSGGFGAVYRASDKQIRNHQVALKLLHAPAASELAGERALRELTLIASVSHPSVVQFKDYGWHEERLWFAMPWYEGSTLDRRFNEGAPMTRAEARPIFERLARGLAAMHDVGIHHHDIKPENIFLADIAGFDGGLPVLLDLGIAAPRGEGPGGLTVEYAAPETAAAALGADHEPIGAAADVFSLSLVLRNLLAPASAPSTQGELLGLLHRRASEPIAPPDTRDLRYLAPAFERWLSLDPAERPSVGELADELALLTLPEERREARRRLLRRLLPIVAIALLAVGALGTALFQQKAQLSEQRERLDAEIRESDELRLRSDQQLMQMEQQMAAIGSKDRELSRAVSIGRQLHNELEREEAQRKNLARRLKRTEDERDDLGRERDALRAEREALQVERDGLRATRDRLQLERDALRGQRDSLAAERDALRERRDKLTSELAAVQLRLTSAEASSRAAAERLSALEGRQRELDQRNRDLDRENTKLLATRNSLEQRIELLERRLAPRLRRSQGEQTPEPPSPDPQ